MIVQKLTYEQYKAAHAKTKIKIADGGKMVTQAEWNQLYGGDVHLYFGEKMPTDKGEMILEEMDDAKGKKLCADTQARMNRLAPEPTTDAFGNRV